MRFNEIRRQVVNCTPRMLTHQLREMEQDGLITRTVYPQVPPKVEYALSDLGRTMEPILRALKEWGDANLGLYGKPRGHDPRDGRSDRSAAPSEVEADLAG